MAQLKRKVEAACAVDVEGLTGEDVKILQEFAAFLRQKRKKAKTGKTKEDIAFGNWPLGVKDGLGRREIYDHL
jgi:hypothetical protein